MTQFADMKVNELKQYAEDHNIDITGLKKKDIIIKLENENKEGVVPMSENTNINNETVTEEVKYFLDDGSECSRSAYIRQEFQKNRSRQDIAKELGLKYYIVYSATANMYNTAHPENGGAGAVGKGSVLVPKVDADLNFVDGDGNVVENEEDAVKVPRAELMRELATAGLTRANIKDHFQVPYATVYAATKEVFDNGDGPKRGSKTIVHPETGEEVKRADYIRELYQDGEGLDRRTIAKQLTELTGDLVDYATVWAATKPKKEKVEEVENVETTEDVENTEEV